MFFSIDAQFSLGDFSLDLSFQAEKGQLVTLLGPSGCGKTTLLRIIAGLEDHGEGSVFLDGQDLSRIPINERSIGFVFQDYALFHHMDVYSNIAYGPKMHGWPKQRISEAVSEKLSLVGLEGYEKRKVFELSGGEQQRVALARALAPEPKLLLLDEPLSALDSNLRVQLRKSIRKIQKQLEITTVYVTHDQEEALSISDRIVLIRNGRLVQTGPPREVYTNPNSLFSAAFFGNANLIPDSGNTYIFFRPEFCLFKKPSDSEYIPLKGKVLYTEYSGQYWKIEIEEITVNSTIQVYFPPVEVPPCPGDVITCYIQRKDTKSLSEIS